MRALSRRSLPLGVGAVAPRRARNLGSAARHVRASDPCLRSAFVQERQYPAVAPGAGRRLRRCFVSDASKRLRDRSTYEHLPQNIILVRHGHSMGNDDPVVYTKIPDWKIPLTPKGEAQACEAGTKIQEIVGASNPCFFYCSPYLRTKMTMQRIRENMTSPVLFTREEPRLREQDFGNFQDVERVKEAQRQRRAFGRFFYRFEQGESGADVYDRVSAFCGTFFRDCNSVQNSNASAILVTHGITARLFVMRWLHWEVDTFEELYNLSNCGIVQMRRCAHGSAYELTGESKALINFKRDVQYDRAHPSFREFSFSR